MSEPTIDDAQAALAAGNADAAIALGWRAVRPAVLAQDVATIRATMHFAEEVATRSGGSTRQDAEALAAYCTACILQPRDTNPSPWSMKRLFSWGSDPKKKCPDCAESIQVEARVCRYCGYRFSTPQTPL